MKILELGQKFRLGEYTCEVCCSVGNYLHILEAIPNNSVFTQFGISDNVLMDKFNLVEADFPESETLEQLTEVLIYILQQAFRLTKWRVTPTQSFKMQKLFNSCGYEWFSREEVKNRVGYIFLRGGFMTYTNCDDIYETSSHTERDPKDFLDLYDILIGDAISENLPDCTKDTFDRCIHPQKETPYKEVVKKLQEIAASYKEVVKKLQEIADILDQIHS